VTPAIPHNVDFLESTPTGWFPCSGRCFVFEYWSIGDSKLFILERAEVGRLVVLLDFEIGPVLQGKKPLQTEPLKNNTSLILFVMMGPPTDYLQ